MKTSFASMRAEVGASLTEYALLLALVSIIAVGAIGFFGSSTSDAFTATGAAMTGAETAFEEKPKTTYTSAGIDGELKATFEWTGDEISLGDVDADGWKYKVKKDTGRKVVVRFTNTETKKVVTVTGWLNKKDEIKTKVKVNRRGRA